MKDELLCCLQGGRYRANSILSRVESRPRQGEKDNQTLSQPAYTEKMLYRFYLHEVKDSKNLDDRGSIGPE